MRRHATCACQAAWYGYSKIVTALLKAGTDPRLVNHLGESAVQAARLAGKPAIVEMLLKGEAEFDAARDAAPGGVRRRALFCCLWRHNAVCAGGICDLGQRQGRGAGKRAL